MKTFKNVAWMVICAAVMIVLAEFHIIASTVYDSYGAAHAGIVWFLGAIFAIKGVHHGAEFFGNFEDSDIVEYQTKD